MQEFINDGLDDQAIKSVFEETFVERKKAANGSLVPLPYEFYAVDKQNKREVIDPSLNKKFSKVFDLNNLLRLEIEFQQNTDFTDIRLEYDRELKSDSKIAPRPMLQDSTDLDTCIKSYAKPELLDGEDKWLCAQCASP